VSHKSPINLCILELLNAQFTSESTVGLVVDILSGNGDRRVGEFAGECEVDGGRGNDDLSGGVALGVVDVGDDGLDGVGDSVPASINELVSLDCLSIAVVESLGRDCGVLTS
jgi:hypothetical protein